MRIRDVLSDALCVLAIFAALYLGLVVPDAQENSCNTEKECLTAYEN